MATKPTWKTQFQLKSFPVLHRRAWIEVFLKYSTGIPSSAAIKRVFSVGSDVMKPKRATYRQKTLKSEVQSLKFKVGINSRKGKLRAFIKIINYLFVLLSLFIPFCVVCC